ncbi:MAG: alpha/beta fold hydrolase [Chloroflexi bacterium]|nr:alpha/beta fold hydrolase [Chloroflexota bacterium]
MDFFPIPEFPEDFGIDPAQTLEAVSETAQTLYGRTIQGVKAIVDSYNIPVGLTPRKKIWQLNKAKLYHYKSPKPAAERHPVPLLLVYALINRPFIFDLAPGRSFIEYMLEEGFDIYLLDWGEPGSEDKHILFDEYVTEYLSRAVRKMRRYSGAAEISMLGYCIGATLAVVYAAIYPEVPLRNLILLTAPIDFSNQSEGSMAVWLEEGRVDIDEIVNTMGNIPGEMIALWAKMLKPLENFLGSYVTLFKQMDNPTAVRGWQSINRWVEDVVPLAGGAFRQFVVEYLRGNELIRGQHEINGEPVKLSNINAALLNIVAQYDHLVSQSQSESVMEMVSSKDKEIRVIPSTHVGIMASRRAKYKLWPELAAWLSERSS